MNPPLSIHKLQAIKKYKEQQYFLSKLILYSLTTCICSLFCSSPFWYSPLRAAVNVFLSVSLPKIVSLFFSTKVVFIVGNLIVIFLLGEFKIYALPQSSPANYYDHGAKSKKTRVLPSINKGRGNFGISLEEKVENIISRQDGGGHMGVGVISQQKVAKECGLKNGESLTLWAHSVQKRMVNLGAKGSNGVTSGSKGGDGRVKKIKDWEEKLVGEGELNLEVRELNKMADDFIERVNKQRRLENVFGSVE